MSDITSLQRLHAVLERVREQAGPARGTPLFGELRGAALAVRQDLAGTGVPFAEVDAAVTEVEVVGNRLLHGVDARELRPLERRGVWGWCAPNGLPRTLPRSATLPPDVIALLPRPLGSSARPAAAARWALRTNCLRPPFCG